jgi:peptidoglycan/LPS O-acetylase OafA/YrhL
MLASAGGGARRVSAPTLPPPSRWWERWFGRETASTQFIPEIDGLRFVAIGAVILYHLTGFYLVKSGRASDALARILESGHFGVPLFFAISGFVIALPFARARLGPRKASGKGAPGLKAYYGRRLTRLEPPYILNLLALTVALAAVKGLAPAVLVPHLAASLVYSHTLTYGVASLINGVAWSLEVEWQFYVLAPVLVSIFRIRAARARRIVLLGGLLAWAIAAQSGPTGDPRFKLSLLFYGPYFLTGLLLADLYVTDWAEAKHHSRAIDVMALACWVAIIPVLTGPAVFHFALPLIVFGAYFGAFRGDLWPRLFRRPPLYLVGGMCYTIYLYHFFFISLFGNRALAIFTSPALPVWWNVVVLAATVGPLTVGACAILFVVTEKPFMRKGWPEHVLLWVRGKRSRAAGPAIVTALGGSDAGRG